MSDTVLDLEKLTADLVGRMETASRACFDSEMHSDWPHYCSLCVAPVILEALREATATSLRRAADLTDSPCGEDDEPHGMTCAWRGSKVYHQAGCGREDADAIRELADAVEGTP